MKLLEIANQIKERDMFEGFNEEDLTEEYPKNFSFTDLKNLNSYNAKKKYLEETFGKPLGSGSSRTVYRIDETKVLKFAKNKRGLAQNEAEIKWFNDYYFQDILADIFNFDEDDHYWVEMELAYKVTVNDFKRLWGIDFKNLMFYLENKYMQNNGKRGYNWSMDDDIVEQMDENEHVQLLLDFMFNSNSLPGDLYKKSSWGKVIRDGNEMLVLIDFGLTSDVFYTYYGN